MRNLLALLATFTLSTSTAVTAVACGTAAQTTVVIFDWNGVINGKQNETSDGMLEFLLNNTDTGIGQTLYKDIVDYISLSILKTNVTFSEDYQFAKQSVENQIKNIQDSLRAKYGRKWETQWKNFLKAPAQGGDGQTGSYQRYFDVLLKSKANTIVNQYYVGDNYHNYQYYSSTEIAIWFSDIFEKMKSNKWTLADYEAQGLYKTKVWIVARSFSRSKEIDDAKQELEEEINKKASISDVSLAYKVAKTKNDQELITGEDYLTDPSSSIKGLLSEQQSKIAQVWMKNQGPIWTRQIVVPFKSNVKDMALKEKIKKDSFDEDFLTRVLQNINNPKLGFEGALKFEMSQEITNVTSSSATGDLGLVTLNSNPENIQASFSYYLYRYVTSAQGVGKNSATTLPYNLPQYTGASANTADLDALINAINREVVMPTDDHTSNFNDLVWMNDADTNPLYSGANGNQVAIFIDSDGIHFVQTQGITYSSSVSTKSFQESIIDYTQLISNSEERKKAEWNDVKDLVDRPGGLTNLPYLNFLQTKYLLWNTRKETTFFDLNDSLSKFTSGASDTSSEIWWDYILFFDKNSEKIHWNLPKEEQSLTRLLGTNIAASRPKISSFIEAMETWFVTTSKRRWSMLQGIGSTATLISNINSLNNKWNGKDYQNGPKARLDPDDINQYLNKVAAATIWYYDPNSIQN